MRGLFILAGLALTGCATAPSQPYRSPQVTIAGDATERVKLVAVQRCVESGGVVEQNTASQLICSKQMPDSFGSFMYQALTTPRYSTRPDLKARYSFVNTGAQTFVTVDTYIEVQNAHGQVDRRPVRNAQVAQSAQAMLDAIKADIEGGASPPAKQAMGG